jgi:hypothetical protein
MSAFGVTIAERAKVQEAPGMTKQKKQALMAAALLGLCALVLAWQYWPSTPEDPAVTATPEIKPVLQAEKKKDIPQLQQMVKDNNPVVASRAVTALANLGHTGTIDQVAGDKRAEVRLAAVGAMTARPETANLATLSRFMQNDPSPDVRLRALSGVASIPSADAMEQLVTMLGDPDPTVRNAALTALEAKTGYRYRDFDPARPNPAVIARIRNQIQKSKTTLNMYFDEKKNTPNKK